jgi:hypothetical protein
MVFKVDPMGSLGTRPTVLMTFTIVWFRQLHASRACNGSGVLVGVVGTALKQVLHVLILIGMRLPARKSILLIFYRDKRVSVQSTITYLQPNQTE